MSERVHLQDSASDLEAIASAAWRVREALHLNLTRIAATDDPVLIKNIVDMVNDLNEHLPLCEDGWNWNYS